MRLPVDADRPWLKATGLAVWLLAAVFFLCAPFLFFFALEGATNTVDRQVLDAVQAQLTPIVEQRNIPTSVVATVSELLDDNRLGLNYLTLRNADRVILLSDGGFEDSFTWLSAKKGRKWRGFLYRSMSFDQSAALRDDGEIVGYIDYGLGTWSVFSQLPLWSWMAMLFTVFAASTLFAFFPITAEFFLARFGAQADHTPKPKPVAKRATAKYQPLEKGGNELQLCDQMGIGYLAVDGQGGVVDVNVNAARIMGFELGRLPGQKLDKLLALEDGDNKSIESPLSLCLQGQQRQGNHRAWLRRRDGKLIGLEMHAAQIPSSARAAAGMMFWEVSKDLNARLGDSERATLANTLMQNVADAVLVVDKTGQVLEANDVAARLFGYTAQDIKALSAIDLLPTPLSNSGLANMAQIEAMAVRKDDTSLSASLTCIPVRWQAKNAYVLLLLAQQSTQAIKPVGIQAAKPEALPAMAYHDPLTGLGSRRHLQERISHYFSDGKFTTTCLLVVIDIVNFKRLNLEYSRELGDEVLVQFGQYLNAACDDTNTAVHLGGDEFALLVVDADLDEDAAMKSVHALLAQCASPMKVSGIECQLKLDVGMSLGPLESDSPEALLQHAETALYTAKAAGDQQPVLYSPGMSLASANDEAAMALRHALATASIEMYMQPIRRAGTDTAIAATLATMRWQSPHDNQELDDAQLWQLAHKYDLTSDLAAWCLRCIAKAHVEWRSMDLALVPVFVSMPYQLIHTPSFERIIASIKSRNGLSDEAIVLCLSGPDTPQEYVEPPGLRTAYAADLDTEAQTNADFLWLDVALAKQLPESKKAVATTKTISAYSRKSAKPLIAGPVEHDAQQSTFTALGVSYLYGPRMGGAIRPRAFARQLAKEATSTL